MAPPRSHSCGGGGWGDPGADLPAQGRLPLQPGREGLALLYLPRVTWSPLCPWALISPSIIEENHLPALPASQGQMELVRDFQEGLACGRDTYEPGPASLPGMVFMASNRPCFPKTEGSRDIGLAVLNLSPRQIGMGSWCGRSPAPAPALLLSR